MATLEFSDAIWTAVESGIFIPVADLPGASAAEFAGAVSLNQKRGQFLYSACKAIRNVISGTSFLTSPTNGNYLGMSVASTETSAGVGLKNRTFQITQTWIGNKGSGTFDVLPVASTGAYSGQGSLLLTDIFPGAVKVASAADTSGAGVLIPSSELVNFGIASHAAINLATDARKLLSAVLSWLFQTELPVRSAAVASPVTSLARTVSNVTLTANATDATNPLTGLSPDQVSNYFLNSEVLNFTIQTIDNDDETFTINSITA